MCLIFKFFSENVLSSSFIHLCKILVILNIKWATMGWFEGIIQLDTIFLKKMSAYAPPWISMSQM